MCRKEDNRCIARLVATSCSAFFIKFIQISVDYEVVNNETERKRERQRYSSISSKRRFVQDYTAAGPSLWNIYDLGEYFLQLNRCWWTTAVYLSHHGQNPSVSVARVYRLCHGYFMSWWNRRVFKLHLFRWSVYNLLLNLYGSYSL